ncbi:hypothetical protein J8TS2_16980 [Lederbergia ruris]|uniref:Uncharacterized protein n=1 Tax=Lederbergia ruris TaxID=217495 RepID=A0ABQ4KHF0_9BACI|nr:hypothetical protein [Lederbergia ruris]GIN57379.1 hypothetical protein J8TS2_16980 [Lederbergia ruris]
MAVDVAPLAVSSSVHPFDAYFFTSFYISIYALNKVRPGDLTPNQQRLIISIHAPIKGATIFESTVEDWRKNSIHALTRSATAISGKIMHLK